MTMIDIEDVKGWVDASKLDVTQFDMDLLRQIQDEVLSRISSVYDTTVWTTTANTPKIIKVIIAKLYGGWLYDRAYSENQVDRNMYAQMLKDNAQMLITGLVDGTIVIESITPTNQGAVFYPNDSSSALTPTSDDMSLGPAKFSLGKVF